MYADDITVWTTCGTLEEKRAALQDAAKCVEDYVKERDLRCSTEKSELLRVGRHPTKAKLEVSLEGQLIPERNMIRVLGMWLQGSRKCNRTIGLLKKSTENVSRMTNRVSQKRHGMREDDTLKLVNSLIVSRVMYSLPYQVRTKTTNEEIEVVLRKAYKTALHLPRNTSNEKLMQLGVSKTFAEMAEAQRKAQMKRLTGTYTGRNLIGRLGFEIGDVDWYEDVPAGIRKTFNVKPIPKNMDPRLHEGRRKARAEYIEKTVAREENTLFTDASISVIGSEAKAIAVVMNKEEKLVSCVSAEIWSVAKAEEIAVALAAMQGYRGNKSLNILTDSKETCHNYMRGRICKTALGILRGSNPSEEAEIKHNLIWIPGHEGIRGNEAADGRARANRFRAGQQQEYRASYAGILTRTLSIDGIN
ncbi:uncharacterized protein [Dermacentor albipictus]|uniref:uncharacterized protein n=1 Tax=Dermacentor albipictus TaxID=60249 RepID=UPI0031FDF6BD